MPIPARPRLEGPAETFSVPGPSGAPAPAGAAGQLLGLQRSAGNAAVASLLQRTGTVYDKAKHVTGIELTVGQEISLTLATKAQQLAAAGVDDTELRKLRTEALGDDTINDDERMFLAALLDAGNATKVAATKVVAGTKFVFDRATIEAHMGHARDLDQAVKDPKIGAERAKAAAATDWADRFGHENEAAKAIFSQVVALVGPVWQAKALDAFGFAIGKIPIDDVLEAMLAAASDDTPGDRTMAAIVYVVAATAGHPMAPMLRAGKIQVDQLTALPGGNWAAYRATAGAGEKGDTISVPTALDVNDLAHRSVVIHELTHAAQDAGATGPKVTDLDREASEIEAYRAGARYQLQQTAPLTMYERLNAVRRIGALLNEIELGAMVLESRADPKAYEPVIREVNAWWSQHLPDAGISRLLQQSDFKIERAMYDVVGRLYGSRDKTTGGHIPGKNALPADALSGESLLDWIDRV